MRKTFLLLFFIISFVGQNFVLAQYNNEYKEFNEEPSTLYLGLGTGVNSYTGLLGITFNYRFTDFLFIQSGAGLGVWGTKLSLGLRYDRTTENGFTYGVSFVNNSGINELVVELEDQSGDFREMTLFLERAGTLNFKTGYNWLVGKRESHLSLTAGYAVALSNQPWQVLDGSILSPNSVAIMDLISPGGFIFELGFAVPIN